MRECPTKGKSPTVLGIDWVKGKLDKKESKQEIEESAKESVRDLQDFIKLLAKTPNDDAVKKLQWLRLWENCSV